VAGGSINPDVAMAPWPLRAFARARTDGRAAIRISSAIVCLFAGYLPLMRGSTSLRDRRCHVLVVTMAIVMVGLHRSV
jgi:hypothetical protein